MHALAVHIHHHFHGYAPGYIGLGSAAFLSWAGVPGPGEAALVAAAVVAARGHLDIAEVVLVAWSGAMLGGLLGWVAGIRGGRALFVRAGPAHRLRLRAVARGERFYERYGLLAVYFTPAWMAGVARMRWTRFLPANAIAALAWSLLVGVGAYFAGPPIVDLLDNVRAGIIAAVVLAAVASAGAARWARRRRRGRRAGTE